MAGSVLIIEENADCYSCETIVQHMWTLNTLSQKKLKHARTYLTLKFWRFSTHQQARGDREDIVYRVLSGNARTGIGNVAENTAVDNGAKNEVNMADEDER